MDEARLAAALRDATDDVQVPRDLVRHAERLGRARRSRRRSAVTTLAVGVVVLAGGALVVPQIGPGTGSASSAAGSAGSDSSAADSSAPPAADPAPRSRQDSSPEARADARSPAAESAACEPALVVDGARVRGDPAPVVAGVAVEIAAAPLCGPASPDGRYTVVLVPRGSQTPTALAEVAPAADGSFAATITLPASTPPGPALLSVAGSDAASACLDDGCTGAGSTAEIDVLPAPEGSS